MREVLTTHRYQERAAILAAVKRGFALFAIPGLGKTIAALRAVQIINTHRVLIVAPKAVAFNTWPDEIAKWDLFEDLTYTIIHRTKTFDPSAQIHIVNPEGLDKITAAYDMIIIDESTMFKSIKSKRFKRLMKLAREIPYRMILTGNPIPKDYQDLYAQMKIVDFGESLGTKIGEFRARYFDAIPRQIHGGLMITQYQIRPGMEKKIQSAIRPRCLTLTSENVKTPPLVFDDRWVKMSQSEQAKYDMFERDMFLEIGKSEVVSFTAGSKYIRCHQLANGACYDENRAVLELHKRKIDMLRALIDELNGQPLLVAYRFEHDIARILRDIKGAHMYAHGDLPRWNKGEIPIMCVQFQSMSHGLNLQTGGRHLAFFSMVDNYDLVFQMICRLHRQGARSTTFVHRIMTRNTVDVVIKRRNEMRRTTAEGLLNALRAYRFGKRAGLPEH